MSAFQRGFVRNYRVVKIEREARNSRFEAKRIECIHPDWQAVLRMRRGTEILPDHLKLLAGGDDLRARQAEVRVTNQMAGNCVDGDIRESHF